MSLLLNQPSKLLCFGRKRPVLVRSSPLVSNGFSPTFPKHFPCMLILADPCGGGRGKSMASWHSGGPKLTLEEIGKKMENDLKLCRELDKELGTIGSSNGWLPTLKEGVLALLYMNRNPGAVPKRISLPPLVTLPHCQTEYVTNVAMSSSSPEDEDCVVAVKFLGPQVSFCRPAQSNAEWVNIRIENPCFFSSPIMFSKKNDMIRIVGSGGQLIGSWDLHKHSENPKLQSLRFQNLPQLTKQDLLDSCYTSEYLVESTTTGETFFVKVYKITIMIGQGYPLMETQAVMVFKVDEDGNAVYTQDIGDQSIFITKSEALCDPLSLSLGRANSVRIFDVDEDIVVGLADQK
ncbi:unnamed protein product [Arabidopsis thaliana]|nr:unnamed protein product [Arabidopsis thaliana]CAD5335017.1 unnamed protein product [Arabidopsis thaliana]